MTNGRTKSLLVFIMYGKTWVFIFLHCCLFFLVGCCSCCCGNSIYLLEIYGHWRMVHWRGWLEFDKSNKQKKQVKFNRINCTTIVKRRMFGLVWFLQWNRT